MCKRQTRHKIRHKMGGLQGALGSLYSLLMIELIIVVSNFPIDRDLDTRSKVALSIMLWFQNGRFGLRLCNAQLAVDPVAFGLGAHLVESVSVGAVGGDAGGDAACAGGDDVCCAG